MLTSGRTTGLPAAAFAFQGIMIQVSLFLRARWRPAGAGIAFFILTSLAVLLPLARSHAQDAAALVNILVQKGILTQQEGTEVRADMQKEFSQSPAGKINLSNSVTQLNIYGDLRLRWQAQ